jgi:uncharacterized delta-60 repeat protein
MIRSSLPSPGGPSSEKVARFSPVALLLLGLVLWAAAASSARAQSALVTSTDFRNTFSRQGAPVVPPGDPLTPGLLDPERTAYDLQFKSGTAFGGWRTTRITSGPNGTGTVLAGSPTTALGATTVTLPSGGGVKLARVRMARPIVTFEISFALGAVIPVPLVKSDGNPAPADFYLPQPANAYTDAPANTISNPAFYWSPHKRVVYATQPGAIVIDWKERVSGAIFRQSFVISTSPAQPERKIFWTEKGFNGPKINVPPSRVGAINIVFNSFVPRTVAEQFVSPYDTPAGEDATPPPELRTLWFDTLDGLIHAYNREGRVFVEYLGNLDTNGVTREQLGFEIVNLLKEARPVTLHADIGDPVSPPPDADPNLSATIIAGLDNQGATYLHEHLSLGGTKRTLYAIRETAPGALVNGVEQQVSNEVLIYWMESGVLSLRWPKHYATYIQQWPAALDKYSLYARPDVGSAEGAQASLATAVALTSANNPALVYQDDPASQQAKLAAGNLFRTDLNTSDPDNRALLRFSRDEDIWFERILSRLDRQFSGYSGYYEYALNTAFDADGEILLKPDSQIAPGSFSLIVSNPATGLPYVLGTDYEVRTNAAGDSVLSRGNLQMDTTFHSLVDQGSINATALQSDGKVVIVGDFTTINGTARGGVARLNSDGTLDPSFAGVTLPSGLPFSVAVQSDGKVLIGGTFTTINGVTRNRIARLNANGTLDTTFGNGLAGVVGDSIASVRGLAVQPDGKVLIAGRFTTVHGTARGGIARLNTNGTLDTTFGNGLAGIPAGSFLNTVVVQPDGKVLIGGIFTTVNGTARGGIARLNANGTLDTAFGNGLAGASSVYGVALQADGKVLIAGFFDNTNGVSRRNLARLNSDGTLDLSFNASIGGGILIAVAVQANGKVLIGGSFQEINGVPRAHFARLNSDGTLDDAAFANTQDGPHNAVQTINLQPDGKVLVGGYIVDVSGTPIQGIARLTRSDLPVLPATVTVTYGSISAFADVGARLLPPFGSGATAYGDKAVYVGYIRQTMGTAFSAQAYQDPFVVGFEEAVKGAIIPINALPGQDKLEVWWYRKSQPPGTKITGTFWPAAVQVYQLRWPAAPPQIVLASNLGSGDLTSLQETGSIYFQNDPALPGYNPNEEHALMISGRAWALRDDLNLATSSQPYVLLAYTEADQRPAMKVFQVLRENATYTFHYNATAGVPLQSPMPLPRLLPLPLRPDGQVANYEVSEAPTDPAPGFNAVRDAAFTHYQHFTFEDRKGSHWVYRGPHGGNGVTPAPGFRMRYFYQTVPGFAFPGLAAQPPIGTTVPYLRPRAFGNPTAFVGDPITGDPLDIVFTPKWPASAPELRISETLTVAKLGLSAVRGQTSAELLYQQSVATDDTPGLGLAARQKSARLYDPTRQKKYFLSEAGLSAVPGSVKTSNYLGKSYFPNLPPHLSQRMYLDPNEGPKGALVFFGQFKDETTGEKYLLLNVLSAEDIAAAKGLYAGDSTTGADKAKWDTAIDDLATTVETFIEDPAQRGSYIVDHPRDVTFGPTEIAEIVDDDSAVDSYAVAGSGGGKGYVVILTGNGHKATPPGEPVSMQVFRVTPPLYRGEVKVINPSNPLDEKLTLQHSGDFAGHPEEYEFEWRSATPVDGGPAEVYDFPRSLLLGDSTANPATAWTLIQNPGADYESYRAADADLSAGSAVNLPTQQIVVNDGNGTPENGTTRPHAILRRSFTVSQLPFRAYLSLTLGLHEGVVVYANQAEVAAYHVDGQTNSPSISSPGPTYSPLPTIFEIDANALTIGENVLVLELYTDADPGVATSVNARLEGTAEAEVENFDTSWLPVSRNPSEVAGTFPSSIIGKVRHTIQGASIATLSDNYFIMRFRARQGDNAAYDSAGGWSKWTVPQLAEGWIKRALAGINPFQQRVTDLFNNPVDTDVSVVMQAGRRWEGDIALNLENINDFGLIEIYETILRRGRSLSIEGNPPIGDSGANDALLLAAGYLSDLYVVLGNEAFADAANPTIAFGLDNGLTFGDAATALFAFKGQVATLMDEELGLLRGRDDFLQPGTRVAPFYNRLVWNYTRGILSGEAIYALNYNIRDMNGDGDVEEADAAKLFPQGNGDAYGHYLTALTGYYSLLHNEFFSWVPRTEAVLVGGTPVQVDYVDERKFAGAAAALARTASQTVDLTYRKAFTASETAGWAHLRDGRANSATNQLRSWGTDDWASRAGQGAYLHWVTANSLLPAVDANPNHEGIQKIDRTTVPELAEIVAQATAIQETLDNADARLNPLGLSRNALAFDISPTEIDAGKTHFEQIYGRAVGSLQNAVTAFNNAKDTTQFLRRQEETLAGQRSAIAEQERAFTNQLIEIYGTPYPDDIGPGRTYQQGYPGPDLFHPMYVEITEDLAGGNFTPLAESSYTLYTAMSPALVASANGQLAQTGTVINPNDADAQEVEVPAGAAGPVEYNLEAISGDFRKPETWTGRRASPGRIQTAVSNQLLARQNFFGALYDFNRQAEVMSLQLELYRSALNAHEQTISLLMSNHAQSTALESVNTALESLINTLESGKDIANARAAGAMEALPKVVGLATDAFSSSRFAISTAGAIAWTIIDAAQLVAKTQKDINDQIKNALDRLLVIDLENVSWSNENKQLLLGLRQSLQNYIDASGGVDATYRRFDQAKRDLAAVNAEGLRVQQAREVFRQRAAAIIQGYRTKDVAFRSFRNEALEKYKTLFDLAARYSYLAARAYDYETGLLNPDGSSVASSFYQKIVQARALGVVSNGQPQFAGSTTGDPGLSGVLAQMSGDWSVVKTRLGFNNPDRYRTTFSLRNELHRIVNGTSGDLPWKDKLRAARMSNILEDPDVKRYCLQVADPNGQPVPGLVIPFESVIDTGVNFFGHPLAGGDHTFTPSSFATKIRSSGIAFAGYVGMDSPTTTSGALTGVGATSPNDPNTGFTSANALSATPYIYLIPAGEDTMRAPPLGDVYTRRTWAVEDQAIPLPFNIANSDYSTNRSFISADSLSEPAFTVRKHQAFRAVPDGTNFSSSPGFTNSRLIGRSVWNTRWKLVIPGNTLLADPNAGLQTFIDTVTDIKLHLESYSYSGN